MSSLNLVATIACAAALLLFTVTAAEDLSPPDFDAPFPCEVFSRENETAKMMRHIHRKLRETHIIINREFHHVQCPEDPMSLIDKAINIVDTTVLQGYYDELQHFAMLLSDSSSETDKQCVNDVSEAALQFDHWRDEVVNVRAILMRLRESGCDDHEWMQVRVRIGEEWPIPDATPTSCARFVKQCRDLHGDIEEQQKRNEELKKQHRRN